MTDANAAAPTPAELLAAARELSAAITAAAGVAPAAPGVTAAAPTEGLTSPAEPGTIVRHADQYGMVVARTTAESGADSYDVALFSDVRIGLAPEALTEG